MSEHRPADRSILLPGQLAAPEGPADLMMMYAYHHGFRRDLDDFIVAASRTPADDRNTWRALLDRWDLFCVVLEDHHNNEDLFVWPLLRERCVDGDGSDMAIVDETEAEHDAIDVLIPSVREAIVARAAGAGRTDPSVSRLLEEVRTLIAAHLAHEERETFRVLQRHLSREEWADLQTQFRSGVRPAVLLKMTPWLMKGLPAAVGSQLRDAGGPGLRLALRLGGRPFRRLDRMAFRHVA